MGKEGHIPPALQYRLLGQGIGIAPEGGVIPGLGYPYQEHPGPFDRQAEQGKYQPDPDRPQLLQPTAQQRQPLPARYQDGNCQRQGLPGLPILLHPQHLGQAVQLDVGDRTLPVLNSGDRAPADIDRHGFQLIGQGLLAHAPLDAQGPHLLAHQVFGSSRPDRKSVVRERV